jgi:uncharacterized membrane protein YdjX (TVP38/TMEM64 family)
MGLPQKQFRRVLALVVMGLIVALALAWTFSPLHAVLDVSRMVLALQKLAREFGLVVVTLMFALALVCVVPLTFATIVAIVALGGWNGFLCVMAGAQLAALCSYGLGVLLGRDVVRGLAGGRVNQLSEKLAQRGLLAVIAVRLVPVAPYSVINMVAGASHIRWMDLALGTLIGMLPGTLIMSLCVEKLVLAVQSPAGSSVKGLLGW